MSSAGRKKIKKGSEKSRTSVKSKSKSGRAGQGRPGKILLRTRAWKAAEFEYDRMQASIMMPFFGSSPSVDEAIDWLEGIIEDCPQFYPAVLDLAVRELSIGRVEKVDQRIEEGFHLMLDLADPKHFDEELDAFVENLEKTWRFDLARRYLDILVGRFPDNAAFHGALAHPAVRLGDCEAALHHAGRAVALEPSNPFFRSNQGWFHLMAGNLEEGREALERALELKPGDEITLGNLKVHAYLAGRGGGTYFDYLLRPADREELDRLADEEDFEKLDALCGSYNSCRLEAMTWTLFLEEERKRPLLCDTAGTLSSFLNFVHGVNQDAYMLDEDIDFVHDHFKALMHKFIVKFGDVDREIIEGICASLVEYYGFLAGRGLVRRAELGRFRKTVSGMKRKLVARMERYNKIRHDEALDEEEKEAERWKIFQGDPFWPHI